MSSHYQISSQIDKSEQSLFMSKINKFQERNYQFPIPMHSAVAAHFPDGSHVLGFTTVISMKI